MGIHISKTPSNCAHKICAFNIFYDVYSIFQLKRKNVIIKHSSPIKFSKLVPALIHPRWPESPYCYLSCHCSYVGLDLLVLALFKLVLENGLCSEMPPCPLGPGRAASSLQCGDSSSHSPPFHIPAWAGLASVEQGRQAALLKAALYPPGKSPQSGGVLLGSWGAKIHLQFSEGSFAIYLVSKPKRNSCNQNC